MAWVPCAMSYRLATVLLCWPHNDMADTVQPTCQAMIRITTHPIYLLDGGRKRGKYHYKLKTHLRLCLWDLRLR